MDFAHRYANARDRILIEMSALEWVSWKILRRVGGVRYSARLLELKRLGYKINDAPDPSGDGKRYRLLSLDLGEPLGKSVKVYLPEEDADALAHKRATPMAAQIAEEALRIFRANRHKL